MQSEAAQLLASVLIYLGKYLYKGVIQEKDILECEKGMVTFRYLHSKTNRYFL